MHNAGASSSDPVNSSVCNACQGLFDREDPRGFILERAPDDRFNKYDRYVYTYIHHDNIAVLLASANAGCSICKIIIDGLKFQNEHDFEGLVAMYSLHQDPDSGAATAAPDEADLTAAQVAEFAKLDGIHDGSGFQTYADGRIVIQVNSDKKSGLAGASARTMAEAFTLTLPALTWPFQYFTTPCMLNPDCGVTDIQEYC